MEHNYLHYNVDIILSEYSRLLFLCGFCNVLVICTILHTIIVTRRTSHRTLVREF